MRKDTNGTGNTEEDGVVVGLGQAIVLEEDTRVSIDVRVWVLGFAVLGQDAWSDLVDLGDELVHCRFVSISRQSRYRCTYLDRLGDTSRQTHAEPCNVDQFCGELRDRNLEQPDRP